MCKNSRKDWNQIVFLVLIHLVMFWTREGLVNNNRILKKDSGWVPLGFHTDLFHTGSRILAAVQLGAA